MRSGFPPQKSPAGPAVPAGRWWLGLLVGLLGTTEAPAADLVPLVAALPVAVSVGPLASVPEYNAKAGYLVTFTRYVEWPAGSFLTPHDPVIIGVLGVNPFGDVLEKTVRGAKSQGRPLEVRYIKTEEEAARCQVVFIARKQERDEAGWLRALWGKPVLTVTESEPGPTQGAVLSLTLDKDLRGTKVVFSASLPVARAAGLQLSALMLASAKKVIREPAAPKDQP